VSLLTRGDRLLAALALRPPSCSPTQHPGGAQVLRRLGKSGNRLTSRRTDAARPPARCACGGGNPRRTDAARLAADSR
jgi:hypothetical protein